MATYSKTWTYPDGQLNRFRDGVAYGWGYQDTLPDGEPNPETKIQFIDRKLIELFKGLMKNYEGERDAKAARISAHAAVDAFTIT